MYSLDELATIGSSVGLRLAVYVFLRWIPGHQLPKIIYSLFAIYVPSFVASLFARQPAIVIEDDIKISVNRGNEEPTAQNRKSLGDNAVVMDKRIVVRKPSSRVWWSLLTGYPSPTSTIISLLTMLINIALVLATLDFIYRARVFYPSYDISFARLGYVSSNAASLLVREPNASQWPVSVSYRQASLADTTSIIPWQTAGSTNAFSSESDYTATFTLKLAKSQQATYQWMTSNNHTGYFKAAPKAGKLPESGSFTFLTSSCIKPRFPYTPTSHPLSFSGFQYMADVVKQIPGGAQFMLFLGDFIYIDVPKRFGASVEDYRREYRQVYASPDWQLASQNLSFIHVIDDHEIANDWDRNVTGVYQEAIDPYLIYHASVNPPKARKAGSYSAARPEATYFEFTQGPASFFMMDTRKYRDSSRGSPPNSTEKSMLGPEQLLDLLAFLKKPEPSGVKWKFLVSSVPFTKNWQINSVDTWAGYLEERQKILEAMWDVGLRSGVGVVVLSGDRHEFAATAFPPPGGGRWPASATVHEYSTSPLSQFYLPIPTYKQTEGDVLVKYVPQGNSKVGAITIENASNSQSSLKFRLYIDGLEAWSSVILSPPATSTNQWLKNAFWGLG